MVQQGSGSSKTEMAEPKQRSGSRKLGGSALVQILREKDRSG